MILRDSFRYSRRPICNSTSASQSDVNSQRLTLTPNLTARPMKAQREPTPIATAPRMSPSKARARKRTCELQNLRREVLQDRRRVDRRLRPDAHVVLRPLLQVTVYTADGELPNPGEAWYRSATARGFCVPQRRRNTDLQPSLLTPRVEDTLLLLLRLSALRVTPGVGRGGWRCGLDLWAGG